MCCIFALNKIEKLDLRFTDIIEVYKEVNQYNKDLHDSIIMEIAGRDKEFINLITFYNDFFAKSKVKEVIINFKNKYAFYYLVIVKTRREWGITLFYRVHLKTYYLDNSTRRTVKRQPKMAIPIFWFQLMIVLYSNMNLYPSKERIPKLERWLISIKKKEILSNSTSSKRNHQEQLVVWTQMHLNSTKRVH